MARFIWTEAMVKDGLAWQKKHDATNAATAKHLGRTETAWTQIKRKLLIGGFKSKPATKMAGIKRKKREFAKQEPLELETVSGQGPSAKPMAVVILQPDQFQEFMVSLWR